MQLQSIGTDKTDETVIHRPKHKQEVKNVSINKIEKYVKSRKVREKKHFSSTDLVNTVARSQIAQC